MWNEVLTEIRERIAADCTIANGASFDAKVLTRSFADPHEIEHGTVMVFAQSVDATVDRADHDTLTVSVTVVVFPQLSSDDDDILEIASTQANDVLIAMNPTDRFNLADQFELDGIDYPDPTATEVPAARLRFTLEMLARRGDHSQGR